VAWSAGDRETASDVADASTAPEVESTGTGLAGTGLAGSGSAAG
jgi:hypothetical protein